MQLYDGMTLEEVTDRQDELFIRIPVQIDPLSRENDCYPNCVAKVERDGGNVVVGWRRTRATTDVNLIATVDHHAVWRNPSGALIDISSRIHIFNGRLEIITDRYSYFMPDASATFEDGRARPSSTAQGTIRYPAAFVSGPSHGTWRRCDSAAGAIRTAESRGVRAAWESRGRR